MKKRYVQFGLYIRKTKDGYSVGFVGAGSVAHFPTYDDAERALENAIDAAWELHGDEFNNTIIEALI